MITSEIRLKVIDIWLEIFSGGTSKPLIVIEQITYLHFIKKLKRSVSAEEEDERELAIRRLAWHLFII